MFFLLVLYVALLVSLRVVCDVAWDTSFKKTRSWLKFNARPDAVWLSAAVVAAFLMYGHVLTGARLYIAALKNEVGYAGLAIVLFSVPLYLMFTLAAMIAFYLPLLIVIEGVFRLMPNSNSTRPPGVAGE
jgi:hypothetical protein